MRKLNLLLVMSLLLFSLQSEAKKVKGIIIFKNDTIQVVFNISVKLIAQELSFEKLQNHVKYFDESGKKKILKPDDAKEFRFEYEGAKVRMVSVRDALALGNAFSSSKNIFLRIIIDDRLRLFRYYATQNSSGMYNASTGFSTGGYAYSVEKYILQNEAGELKQPKELTFRKDMAKYFSDCTELVEKIESKDFRKNDLEYIVRFYNSRCR